MVKHLYRFALIIGLLQSMAVSAQPLSPGDQANLYLQQQRINDAMAQQNQIRANAEAQRQWQQREDAIQAQIAKWRATPYYGSLAANTSTPLKTAWGGGGKVSKERAEESALNTCAEANCKIIATFANACVGAAIPEGATSVDQWIVAIDKNPRVAVEKAYYSCESKYGKGTCFYLKNGKKNEKYFNTFCSGYDYEAYDQN